jgi:hypothetical protein
MVFPVHEFIRGLLMPGIRCRALREGRFVLRAYDIRRIKRI